MLENARRRLGKRVDIRLHDLRRPLDFLENNSVDLVLSSLVLDYIEDWVPVLREFRRVLKPDGSLVFSVGHPASYPFMKIEVEDYFRVEKTEMTWVTWGEPVVMPSYRRPLQNITESLHKAGFLIERMIEAQPTEDYKKADPESYERVRRRPIFINVKAILKIRA
jgi:SAM-dependent methyltransferase